MKNIKIKNLNLSYIEKGSGRDVVFLHGWMQNKESFQSTFDYLSNDYHVYSIDFFGHGDSDDPTSDYDIYKYEEALEEFFEKSNIKDPIIIAHSFGARVALIYRSRYKSSTPLILTGAAGIKPKRSLRYHLAVSNYKIMKFLVKTPLYSHYKEDLYSQSGSEDYRNASENMKPVFSRVVNEDLTHSLKLIENHTLLYWGENDDQTPIDDAHKMNKDIINSTLIIKENSGHFAFIENKDNFNKEIKNFLKKYSKM